MTPLTIAIALLLFVGCWAACATAIAVDRQGRSQRRPASPRPRHCRRCGHLEEHR